MFHLPATEQEMAGALANEKITILLVGRSGNGKSSIFNSIFLGSKLTECNGIRSTVIDIDGLKKEVDILEFSGIIDDDEVINPSDTPMTLAKQAIEKLNGVSVIVFVLKYGVRYTNQEKTAVRMTKDLFCESIFKDRGILAFSYGDNFHLDQDGVERCFKEWCAQQTGEIKSLFNEVENRCCLFNNKIDKLDDTVLKQQRNDFWEKVNTLLKQRNFDKYDLQMFEKDHMIEEKKKKNGFTRFKRWIKKKKEKKKEEKKEKKKEEKKEEKKEKKKEEKKEKKKASLERKKDKKQY
ncbi:hypothetical protein Btru_048170 [Bulinus truncatus]|nr:hypothetical protein Btru_048170 [Bulinus truncatus]